MLSCLVPPSSSSSSRFGQEDNILIKQSMPSSPAFSVQFPPLASSLHIPHHHQQSDPKNSSDNISIDHNADDDNRSSPVGRNDCDVIESTDTSDCTILCPHCTMRFNNSEAFRDHIIAVHPNDKLNVENIVLKHNKVNSEPPQTDEDDSNHSSSSSQLARKYNQSNNNNNSSLKNNNNSIISDNNEDEDRCTPQPPAASTTPSSSAHPSPNPLSHNGLVPLAGDLSTSAFAAAAAAYAESTLHHHQHSHLHSHANAMTPHRHLHSTTAAQLMAALAASTLTNGHHPGLHHLQQQQQQQQISLLATDMDGTRSASSPSSTIGENVPPYGCLQCTAFFPTREQLDKHEAMHSPNAQAQGQGVTQSCKICHKTFANVYRLQRHMISHDESALLRKFKCNQCDKAFKFKHHLKEHVRIHSGEKPFGCDNCGKRFSHSGSFSSHMTSKKCISMGLKLNNNRAMLKNIERSSSDTTPSSSSMMDNSPKRVTKLANGLLSTDSGSTGVLQNPINYFASDVATSMGGSPTSTATSSPFYPNYNAMNAALLASFPHPFYSMALDPRMHPYNIQRLLELTAAGQHQQQQEQDLQKHRDDEETPDDSKLVMDLRETTRPSQMDFNSSCNESTNPKINDTIEDDDDNETESVSNKPKECLEYLNVGSPKVVVSHNEETELDDSKIPSKDSSKDYLRKFPQDIALEVHVKQEPFHAPSPTNNPQTESDEEPATKVNQSPKIDESSTPLKDHQTSDRCEIAEDTDDSSDLRCRRCDKRFNHPTELVQHEKVLCGYIKQELEQRFQQQLVQKPQQQKQIGETSFEATTNTSFLQSSDAEDEPDDRDSSSRNECGSENGERKVRVRTAITEEQQQQLKQHYALNARPSRDEFRLIATRLQLDARVVQVWFQNNRSRERKMQCYQNNNNNTYNKMELKASLESPRDSTLNASGSNVNEEQPLDLSVKRDFTTKLNGHALQHSPLYGTAPLQITGFAEAINLSRKMSSSSLSPSSLSPSSAASVPHGFKQLTAGASSSSEVHYFGAPPPPPPQPHTFHLSPSHSTKEAVVSTTSNTMPTSSITQTPHGTQNCGSSFSTLPPYILASAVQRQLVPMPMDALFPMSPVAAAAAEYARQNPALMNSIKLRAAAGASGLPDYRGTSLSPGGSEKRSWRDDDSRVSHEDDFQGNSLGGLMPPKPKRLKAETHGHAGDPDLPFVCDQCDKAFAKQSSLARHKYEHSGQRPYQCVDCPKAFKHKHHLTEHKRLHSGEKPFQCSKCLKRFSHSGSYSQHMNHRYSYCKPYRE